MAWKEGPLPPDTYGWGGVVLMEDGKGATGFYFADFHGDHVLALKGNKDEWQRVEPDQVQWYDNGLQLPLPRGVTGLAGPKA